VTANNYPVIYILAGGTNSPENPVDYYAGSSVTLADPTKDYYDFSGWFSDEACTVAVTGITPADYGNMVLYAKWSAHTYSVTYVDGGKTNTNAVSYTVESPEIVFTDSTKDGYTFSGWFSDEACTVAVTGIPAGSHGDLVIYAGWKTVEYKITYKLDDGTNSSENPVEYTVEGDIVLAQPSKTGFSFEGWYADAEFTQAFSKIVPGTTGDFTLYAKWEVVNYSITYMADGGSCPEDNPSTYTVLDTLEIKDASKKGFRFDGWFMDEACTVPAKEIPAGTTGDLTLYAKYTEENNTLLIIGLIAVLVVIILAIAYLLRRSGYFNKEF